MIGIYDYGIGGLGVYRLLRARHFKQAFMYFSDAGYQPYGQVEQKELRDRVSQVINFFHGQGVNKIAVACNAASSVLPGTKRDKNILSIIDFGIEVVKQSKIKNLAIWGGGRTIDSNIYPRLLKPLSLQVSQLNTQFLSLQIEKGDTFSTELIEFAKATLKKSKQAEGVLLACTHYPAILPLLQSVDPAKRYLDPADEMANFIVKNWQESIKNEVDCFYTTGDKIAMKKAAKVAFAVDITNVQRMIL